MLDSRYSTMLNSHFKVHFFLSFFLVPVMKYLQTRAMNRCQKTDEIVSQTEGNILQGHYDVSVPAGIAQRLFFMIEMGLGFLFIALQHIFPNVFLFFL